MSPTLAGFPSMLVPATSGTVANCFVLLDSSARLHNRVQLNELRSSSVVRSHPLSYRNKIVDSSPIIHSKPVECLNVFKHDGLPLFFLQNLGKRTNKHHRRCIQDSFLGYVLRLYFTESIHLRLSPGACA